MIFTEAMPTGSWCAGSNSASRADVLQAADQTHPPASKRETTPSFIIIHITHPHKVWLPDEERECMLLQVRHLSLYVRTCVCVCVCAFCSSSAACARENTASYSQKPGFGLFKNLSLFFRFRILRQRKKSEERQYEQRRRRQESAVLQKLLPLV